MPRLPLLWCLLSLGCDIHPDDSGAPDSDSAVDTGPVVPTCASAREGGRTVKLCGASPSEYVGSGLSSGEIEGVSTLAVGSYTYEEGQPIAIAMVQDFSADAWLSSSWQVAGTSDADTSSFGYHLDISGDLDGDGSADLAATAQSTALGSVLIFDGPLVAGLSPTDYDAVLSGDDTYRAGAQVGAVPDIDADGDDELMVVTRIRASSWTTDSYLYQGPVVTAELADASAHYNPETFPVMADVLSGDIDGDGLIEVMISDILLGGSSDVRDSVGVLYMVPAEAMGEVTLADYDAISLEDGWYPAPSEANMTDIDGDGYQDLLVELLCFESKLCGGTSRAGLFSGPIESSIGVSDAASTFTYDGETYINATLGGDLDGDGQTGDAVVTVQDVNQVWVVPAPFPTGDTVLDADNAVLSSDLDPEQLNRLAALPDVDADGYDDVAISALAAEDGGAHAGAVYILFGGSW